MENIRTAIARVLHTEVNGWTWDFALTIAKLPPAVVDGRITGALLDMYPTDTSYPAALSRAIAHQAGLRFRDELNENDPDDTDYTYGEGIGMAIHVMLAVRTGEIGYREVHNDSSDPLIQFYRDNVERNGLTIEGIREFVKGMSWTEVAQLFVDAHSTSIGEADPAAIPGTGGFVYNWLRPGDYGLHGHIEDGEYGIGIVGGVTELLGSPQDLAEFGQAVATRWQSPLVIALSDLGDTIDQYPGFATGLRCDQADALAKVLALSGQHDTAVKVIAEHAHADDEPDVDLHAHIRAAAGQDLDNAEPGNAIAYEQRDTAATDYVRMLTATS
jgi:hypothetical protein